jgi:dephospho-CoA kinase
MKKNRTIVAAIGLTETKAAAAKKKYQERGFIVLDFDSVLPAMMEPGQEGYRQVLNFFGEEYLLKSGKINLNKLRKFISDNEHKIRIFHFMMEPVFLNLLQELSDRDSEKSFLVIMPRLVSPKNISRFDSVIS